MDERTKSAEQVMMEEAASWMPPAPNPQITREFRRQTIDGWLDMLDRCTLESEADMPVFEELCAYLIRIREDGVT